MKLYDLGMSLILFGLVMAVISVSLSIQDANQDRGPARVASEDIVSTEDEPINDPAWVDPEVGE